MATKIITTKKVLWSSLRLITSKEVIVAKIYVDIALMELKKLSDTFFFSKKSVILHSVLGINHFFIENIQYNGKGLSNHW